MTNLSQYPQFASTADPSVYLTTLPDLDKNANTRNNHSEALFNAVQAGFLYFLARIKASLPQGCQ